MAITKSFFEEKKHKFAATAAIETFVIGADAKSVNLGKHIAGDTIAIEDFAGEFSISRVGGKLTLVSSSGQTIKMQLVKPASGTNSATLQFLDGSLVLTRGTDGQVKIGTMNVTGTPQEIDDNEVSGTDSRALIDEATAPAQLPDAEYTLTSAASVDEGDTIIFTLDTKNVAPGSILNYTLSGISGSDINGPLSGTAVVDNLGKALIEVKVAADQLTEAVAESLTVNIVGTSATKSAVINDTSMTPEYTLTGAASVDEGDTIIFTLDTKNVAPGSTLNYTLSGISGSDINGPLSGTAVVDNLGKALIEVKVAADQLTEAVAESLTVNIVGTSATKSAVINDTSMTPGQTLRLSTEDDIRVGTNASDTFKGRIGTVGGNEANTLNSGDFIDGQGGRDTLEAQVFSGSTVGGGSLRPIQPEITDVEVIKLEAQYDDLFTVSASPLQIDDVVIRASEITGVDQLWSNKSTADLIIQDLTTKDSDGTVRDTSEMTIGMAYTGNSDQNWDESDYKVYFDQDYLTPGRETGRAAVDVEAMNEDAYDAGKGPLEGVYFSQFDLTVNGTEFSLVPFLGESATGDGSEIKTYAELLAKVQQALTALKAANSTNAAIQTLEAELGPQFTSDEGRLGTSIRLTIAGETNGTNNTLSIVPADLQLSRAPQSTVPNNNRYEQANNNPALERTTPVEINIALEKVGLSGDGGDLVIGSMNKDAADSNNLDADGFATYNETVAGFEKFNVTVLGDASKPSSLGTLRSTNNTLETVVVNSETRTDNSYASLIIGNMNAEVRDQGLKDVRTFDATGLKGDLTLRAVLTNESARKYTEADQGNFDYLTGSGDDAIDLNVGDFWNNELGGFDLDIETNDGDDTVRLTIDGDALDFAQSAVHIATGAGRDTIRVTTAMSSAQGNQENGNEILNQAILNNFTIDAGGDNDTVLLVAGTQGNFIINGGGGDDFIRTSDNVGPKAAWVFNVDTTRVALESPSLDDLPGKPLSLAFIGGAKLTVTLSGAGVGSTALAGFAAGGGVMSGDTVTGANGAADAISDSFANGGTGFVNGYESTVTIDVGGSNTYFGTQADINNAILRAINDDPVLSNLLRAYISSNNTLVVESLVDGVFDPTDLDINIQQATYGNPTNGTAVLNEARSVFQNSALTMVNLWGASPIETSTYAAAAPGALKPTAVVNTLSPTEVTDQNNYYSGLGAAALFDDTDTVPTAIPAQAGSASTQESDNVIDGGAGNDLIVLSTDAQTDAQTIVPPVAFGVGTTDTFGLLNGASNETIRLTGSFFGHDTIMNFTDVLGESSAGTPDAPGAYSDGADFSIAGSAGVSTGVDFLDFTAYLTGRYDSSVNTTTEPDSDVSNIPVPVSLHANATDNVLTANEVVVTTVEAFEAIVGTDQDWGTLETSFLTALRATTTAGYTVGITSLVGDAASDLVGLTQKVIFMIENDDSSLSVPTGGTDTLLTQNLGHYKVFEVTMSNGVATADQDGTTGFISANYLGSLDFGHTLNLTNVNLVGSTDHSQLLANGFDFNVTT